MSKSYEFIEIKQNKSNIKMEARIFFHSCLRLCNQNELTVNKFIIQASATLNCKRMMIKYFFLIFDKFHAILNLPKSIQVEIMA